MKILTALLATSMMLVVTHTGLLAQEEEQEPQRLTIGSVAPPLDVEHWVQDGEGNFPHTNKFEDGKVYLVEFWATWCGPCIASMPHISEIQQQHADKGFQVISVSREDLETVEEFLERDVRGEDEMTYRDLTKTYCLTTDPDGSVHADYMKAAGQNGIPTAFLVGKSGHVEWIGHPMRMDPVIEQVLNDEWDREAFAVTFKAQQQMQMLQSQLGALMRQEKSDEAIALLDEAIGKMEDESMIKSLTMMRSQILITSGAEGAAEAMRTLTRETNNATLLNQMAWSVVEMQEAGKDVRDNLVAAAAEAARKGIDLDPQAGHIIDTLAHLVYMQGDLDEAIKLTERAVELSGDEFPEIGEFLEKLKKEKADQDD